MLVGDIITEHKFHVKFNSRSQWPHGLILGSVASSLLGLQVRILSGHGGLSIVSLVCCPAEVSAMS